MERKRLRWRTSAEWATGSFRYHGPPWGSAGDYIQAENELGREQPEHNGHTRCCDDRVRIGACGRHITGHPCVFQPLVGPYSLKREEPVVDGSKFVCLSSKLGLPAVSEGFLTV